MSEDVVDEDRVYILKALGLASASKGMSSPNPSVGAVVVRGGKVLGQGVTQELGSDHAEVVAIRRAKRLCGDISGSTLYVTLEPCSFFGRTPPCTDLIISEGISRVVVGTKDRDPRVSGRGIECLRGAGIELRCGIEEFRINRLNEDFNKYITLGIPFCTAKYAMSIDGKMATDSGDSKWISNEESRLFVQRLRKRTDAIVVGSGTLLMDDPRLTLRIRGRQPLRVVLLGRGDLSLGLRVFTDEHRTLVVLKECYSSRKEKLIKLIENTKNKELIYDTSIVEGIDLLWLFRELAVRGVSSVLLEGGASILSSALSYGLVDKLVCFIAPKIIQGVVYSPFSGLGSRFVRDAYLFKDVSYRRLGDNMMFTGYISYGNK